MKEERICPVCGKPLPDIRGGRKAHEGFCTKVRRASYMREYMREYYRGKRRKRPVPEDPPVPEETPRRLTLDEFAAKARSQGKTYGQLRAEMLIQKRMNK